MASAFQFSRKEPSSADGGLPVCGDGNVRYSFPPSSETLASLLLQPAQPSHQGVSSPTPTTPPPVRRQPTRPPSACNKPPHSSSSPKQHGNKTCLNCGSAYTDTDNGPLACHFHGHMTGHRGLLSFAPPHQGIDGEWTEESGIIVYKWNSQENRPNTGSTNWKKRWTCCGVSGEDARPCRRGWHVCYDDGATRY